MIKLKIEIEADGERRDLNYVTIDMSAAPEFHRRVYDAARRIPAGATLSNGEVAERLSTRHAGDLDH
jgi:O6-methylguanine-DNA--protein-cysteine methyltransferase